MWGGLKEAKSCFLHPFLRRKKFKYNKIHYIIHLNKFVLGYKDVCKGDEIWGRYRTIADKNKEIVSHFRGEGYTTPNAPLVT